MQGRERLRPVMGASQAMQKPPPHWQCSATSESWRWRSGASFWGPSQKVNQFALETGGYLKPCLHR